MEDLQQNRTPPEPTTKCTLGQAQGEAPCPQATASLAPPMLMGHILRVNHLQAPPETALFCPR